MDDKAYQDYFKKDRLKKRLKRLENKQKPLPEQEAHKVAEKNRVRNYWIQKKKVEDTKAVNFVSDTPYRSRQSTGKTLKKVEKSLSYSPRKRKFLLAKMVTEGGLQVKGLNATRKRMDLSEEQICLVTVLCKRWYIMASTRT